MKTVYKVVQKSCGYYYSVTAPMKWGDMNRKVIKESWISVRYEIGTWTTPKLEESSLFVFLHYKDAVFFARTMADVDVPSYVLRCEAKQIYACDRCMLIAMERFWKNGYIISGRHNTTGVPMGTFLTQGLLPIQLVAKVSRNADNYETLVEEGDKNG